jgi:xanthine/CO dehydrogenase XdhC/CoxF family maturation factor/GTP:adenosylcobinamide-phosphate guanylyltransferase
MEGLAAGTLGGGILEFEAGIKAKEALESGNSQLFEFDLDADIHDKNGAICGGKATVLIDAHPEKSKAAFLRLRSAFNDFRPGAIITKGTSHPDRCILDERVWIEPDLKDDLPAENGSGNEKFIHRSITNRIPVFIMSRKEHSLTGSGTSTEWIFIDPFIPPERLVIVGGGHVGRALVRQASRLGFDTTVIDNRPGIIPQDEVPAGVKMLTGDIEKETGKLRIDPDTYIVIATQGHQFDAVALKRCIRSGAAYIGLMGSHRKLKLMRERFIDEGWATGSEFDAVHAPIGIDIHSETVEEIAVSIAAELIKVRKEQRDRYKIPNICNMILAAGESRRMKQQKLLMDYHGESFVKAIVRKSLASEADETLVVLGSHSREIFGEISEFKVNTVYNPLFKEGMLSSIQCGFRSVSKKVNAVVLMLGDQPMIGPEVVDELIAMYRKTRAGIVVPVYKGQRGHPVLIDTRFRDEIFLLDPGMGLKGLMRSHPEEIRELEIDNPNILKDIDNVDDYKIEIT